MLFPFRWKRRPKQPRNNPRPGAPRTEAQLIYEASRDVVERARAGDQVAMAIIAEVRDNAKRGDARAKYTADVMRRYIADNPPIDFGVCDVTHFPTLAKLWGLDQQPSAESAARVFIETADKVKPNQAIVALVHGPNNEALAVAVRNLLTTDGQKAAFSDAADQKKPRKLAGEEQTAWNLGRIFAFSRAIRRLADESFPISMFCPACGWEFGE